MTSASDDDSRTAETMRKIGEATEVLSAFEKSAVAGMSTGDAFIFFSVMTRFGVNAMMGVADQMELEAFEVGLSLLDELRDDIVAARRASFGFPPSKPSRAESFTEVAKLLAMDATKIAEKETLVRRVLSPIYEGPRKPEDMDSLAVAMVARALVLLGGGGRPVAEGYKLSIRVLYGFAQVITAYARQGSSSRSAASS